ncbi:MAG: phosphatidylglycerol lysyltransferase domain-containing protein [Desulfuromonadaceae bacterium]|nr:phosphatidylglycerol lysyltransferase domain-containing protein [Desulfuromonadaceae bacterium]
MKIPTYPASRPLALTDKPLLDQLCTNVQPRVSELSFAGLYLFRKAHEYKLATVAGSIVVIGTGYDGSVYFLPPLGGDTAAALNVLFTDGLPLYGADDIFVEKHLSTHSVQIAEMRDSFDYLYLREELALLPGSRFHKKKNRINYFTSRHDYRVDHFSDEHVHGCLTLLDTWQQVSRVESGGSVRMEIEATEEALHIAKTLGLAGIVIMVNGVVAAFALGEQLNPETAVCHFEKADPFSEGLYQLVNREFAKNLFQDCTYLNREQDLGNTGLRSAKLSYHPVELIRKYLVTGSNHKDFVALY